MVFPARMKTLAALFTALCLLCGCTSDETEANSVPAKPQDLITQNSSERAPQSKAASSEAVSDATREHDISLYEPPEEPLLPTEPDGVSEAPIDDISDDIPEEPPESSEDALPSLPPIIPPDGTELMYVTREKYAKKEPYPDAERSTFYDPWTPVFVSEKTETGYYRLYNGDYIASRYLKTESEPLDFPVVEYFDYLDEPEEIERGSGSYDPQSAIEYAEANWNKWQSLCAEFVSECLTAGGLVYDIASATELYNTLVEDGRGTAVRVMLNEDGTGTLPDYVEPGDLIFYYCCAENLMVHVAVYNGSTSDGLMTGFAHNLSDDGKEAFTYNKYCPGMCGCPLDRVIVFCLDN